MSTAIRAKYTTKFTNFSPFHGVSLKKFWVSNCVDLSPRVSMKHMNKLWAQLEVKKIYNKINGPAPKRTKSENKENLYCKTAKKNLTWSTKFVTVNPLQIQKNKIK